jgi:hypothetical protein
MDFHRCSGDIAMTARALILPFLLAVIAVAPAQTTEYLQAIPSADSVTVVNANIVENCAARFAVDVRVNGTDIAIIERDTVKEKARCMCQFTLTAVVRGLSAGTYTVQVMREYLQKFGYPSDSTVSIGFLTWTIVNAVAQPVSYSKRQSDCQNSTDVPSLPATPMQLTVSPNPFRERTSLMFELESAVPIMIDVHDASGRFVFARSLGLGQPGTNRWTFPADAFPTAGWYYFRVTAGGRVALVPALLMH